MFRYPEQYLNSVTERIQMYILCSNFQNTRPNVSHILHVSIFNNNIPAIYPSVYTVLHVKALLPAWSMRPNFIWGIRYHFHVASGSIIGSSSPSPRGHSPYVLWGSRSWWTSYGTAGTLPWAGSGCAWACACWASSSGWTTGHTPRKHTERWNTALCSFREEIQCCPKRKIRSPEHLCCPSGSVCLFGLLCHEIEETHFQLLSL